MTTKQIIGVAAVVCLALVAVAVTLTWLYRDEHWRGVIASAPAVRDTTVQTDALWLPAPVITPNPSPAVPRPDLTDKRRVDSLIAVVQDKDSLIRELSTPTESNQTFTAKDPNGFEVSGMLTNIHRPIEKTDSTIIRINPIPIPVTTVTVTQTIIEERVSVPWVIVGAVGGVVIGGVFVWEAMR